MIRAEMKLEEVARALSDEKAETREYRVALQNKVDGLIKICFIGLGVVMTLQFIAPFVIKALLTKS